VVLLSLPAAGLATGVIAWFVARSESTADRTVLSLSVALLVVLSGLQRLWANYLRGFGQVRVASMLEGRSGGAVVAVIQALLVIAVWQLFPSWGLAGALAAVVLGYAIHVGFASRIVARYWGHATSKTHIIRDLRRVAARDWKFASVQVASLLNASVEIWIAGIILSSIDTSMFGAAQRLSMLVVLPMTALQSVLSPTVSRLAARGSRPDMERFLRSGATFATAATALVCLPLLLAPGPILNLVFGPGFEDAAVPLVLLTAALFVNALTGLAGLTLSMAHREGTAAKVQWSALIPRVIIGAAVAAAFGLNALAMSAAVVSMAMFVTMWVRARRELGVNTAFTATPDLSIIRHPAGAVG
jgi:O-antigen/teichoic acid export membrane protein